MSEITKATTGVYESVTEKVFSGRFAPGDRLVEQDLADELGVSRIPVREALGKMVAQGVLLGGKKHQGVWMRDYSPEEIRQLYEFRGLLESGVAGAAAEAATESDLTHMEIICEQMEAEIGNVGSGRWAELDRKFHETLADAGHNERFAQALKTLLSECYFVFYFLTAPQTRAVEQMRDVIKVHRGLLDLIRQRKPEEAKEKACMSMRASADRVIRRMIKNDLKA